MAINELQKAKTEDEKTETLKSNKQIVIVLKTFPVLFIHSTTDVHWHRRTVDCICSHCAMCNGACVCLNGCQNQSRKRNYRKSDDGDKGSSSFAYAST